MIPPKGSTDAGLPGDLGQVLAGGQGGRKRDVTTEAIAEVAARLSEADRTSLLKFARFLESQGDGAGEESGDIAAGSEPEPAGVPEPEPIPRPEGESVIKAMRRLTATYYMLDRGKLLNEASSLMAQHVMQGREASEVIDELETVFWSHYQARVQAEDPHRDGNDKDSPTS
ncbi:hypothetical protein [Thioalkalivibrio halophilus]|uniref:Crp/Fnr family transcriptional regulator n=1 Tax=Thioalkalivibrio halophilus TaxID=252474 RepID=A0A1V2ZZW0_9GAMM|nr:hypothetical protein [Thioalkalivibrio halophilus]OOC10373.1 hypothetical protein B1A74_06155 [Thioalkalivibrio halophilus]